MQVDELFPDGIPEPNIFDRISYKLEDIYDFFRYDLPYGIKNLIFYFKVIWKDRWYDHSYLLNILERKIENMERNWHKSHYLRSEKQQKQMKIARLLLNRLNNSEHYNNKDYLKRINGKLLAYIQEEQDFKLLMKILDRNLRTWWD